jgi:hypothetical protein
VAKTSTHVVGTAVWEIDANGVLKRNWVDRNAFEVCGAITREDCRKHIF